MMSRCSFLILLGCLFLTCCTKDDGTTIKTDVSDSYTDEPARAPKY